MDFLKLFQNIENWIDQYPWLEMLTSLCILIILAMIANFIAKQIVVRGIRKLISKIKFANQSIFAQHSVIRRIANIVPAVVMMNGITTVPHLSEKIIIFVQMASQAFIFLTITLSISEMLNIFNLVYQRNPNAIAKYRINHYSNF